MSKSYNVNYLLSISRLPDHFYSFFHGLTGKAAEYQNPGVALRSFVIAKCLRRDTVDLDGSQLELVRECEDFSYSGEILSALIAMLEKQAKDLTERLVSFGPNKKFVHLGQDLTEMVQAQRLGYDAFIMSQDPTKNQFNIFSAQALMLREVMYDLLDKILDVEYELESFSPSPEIA